ncbi:hypothetical protein JB92DRAFT_2695366 [Gautieria morchelliformis]|nr:hypothetical protein JB92DRAFT_2695366 [Gautieria morchelliformis]
MEDMHEATFLWSAHNSNEVILTGTFDQWSSSIRLTKTPRGFEGKVKLPWSARVLYKFVVDGRWRTAQSHAEDTDSLGNVNNIYECVSFLRCVTVMGFISAYLLAF